MNMKNKSCCRSKQEAVKKELEDKINSKKGNLHVKRRKRGFLSALPGRRPFTLRVRVKNTSKYIESLMTDIRSGGADLHLRGSGTVRFVPKLLEKNVVWLDARCELSDQPAMSKRMLDSTEFGSSPHAKQNHAMKIPETRFKTSMDLTVKIKDLSTKDEGLSPRSVLTASKFGQQTCRVQAARSQVNLGRSVIQVKLNSVCLASSSKNSEANKLYTSHNDNKDTVASPPNSPLYDMPPPSTPAQRGARRAKRNLQLEMWRKNEDAKSRQERYERRAKRGGVTKGKLKHIQWKENLVECVYFHEENQGESEVNGT